MRGGAPTADKSELSLHATTSDTPSWTQRRQRCKQSCSDVLATRECHALWLAALSLRALTRDVLNSSAAQRQLTLSPAPPSCRCRNERYWLPHRRASLAPCPFSSRWPSLPGRGQTPRDEGVIAARRLLRLRHLHPRRLSMLRLDMAGETSHSHGCRAGRRRSRFAVCHRSGCRSESGMTASIAGVLYVGELPQAACHRTGADGPRVETRSAIALPMRAQKPSTRKSWPQFPEIRLKLTKRTFWQAGTDSVWVGAVRNHSGNSSMLS
jgi:hypothetical protein